MKLDKIFAANTDNAIITVDNLDKVSRFIAVTALTTIRKNSSASQYLAKSTLPLVDRLLYSIIFDDTAGEGLDIVSALHCVLFPLCGKSLFTDFVPEDVVLDDGCGHTLLAKGKRREKRQDGSLGELPRLTIWRSALRLVNTIVFTNKRELKHTCYLEEVANDGKLVGYIAIPEGYDYGSADEYRWLDYVADALCSTSKEKRLLKKLYGECLTISEAARQMCIGKSTAVKAIAKIRKAYLEKYADLQACSPLVDGLIEYSPTIVGLLDD